MDGTPRDGDPMLRTRTRLLRERTEDAAQPGISRDLRASAAKWETPREISEAECQQLGLDPMLSNISNRELDKDSTALQVDLKSSIPGVKEDGEQLYFAGEGHTVWHLLYRCSRIS